LVRVKLNGTIHADAQGTYMMCGAKRVPVVVQNADGEVLSIYDRALDVRSDTDIRPADGAGKVEER
jgi:hypothetical protein